MLPPRYPPEPYIPRIIPLIWADPSASHPSELRIDACLEAARRLRPCFGPRGLPKPLAFRFLNGLSAPPVHTPDTASVLEHMGLEDPAARALASAAIAQAREVGDGSALVLLLGASLLEQAQVLLALGLTQREVEAGYRLACSRALELLDGDGGEALAQAALEDPREERQVAGVLRILLSTRVPEMADVLAEAVARCCVRSWTRDGQGLMTFDPSAIEIIKTIAEGPPDQTTEEQQECPQEASDEEKSREEKKEVTRKQVQEASDEERSREEKGVEKKDVTRQQLQGERDEESDKEEPKSEEEEDWLVHELDDKEEKPKRKQASDEVGVYPGATIRVQDREQLLIDQFLSDYVVQRHPEKGPPAPQAHRCSEGTHQESEPDEDWEILSLALEEIRLDGEEGADGGEEGLGEWQTEEVEYHLLEKLRGQGDGRRKRWGSGVATAAALKGSTAACKRLVGGLLRLGRKYLVPRARGQGKGQGKVGDMHRVQKRRRIQKPHRRPMGKVQGPCGPSGKQQHPRKNSCVSKRAPQPGKPLQASLGSLEATDQESQESVSITLHSPDRELLERCEAAIRACLRLYGAMQSDPRLVSGAGAAEAALSARLCKYGLTLPGLEQMAVHGFAQALLAPVRVLGENQGTPADMAVTRLHEALRRRSRSRSGSAQGPHERLEDEEGDLLEALECKRSALKKATAAVLSVMADLRSHSPGERGTETEGPKPGHQSVQQP